MNLQAIALFPARGGDGGDGAKPGRPCSFPAWVDEGGTEGIDAEVKTACDGRFASLETGHSGGRLGGYSRSTAMTTCCGACGASSAAIRGWGVWSAPGRW